MRRVLPILAVAVVTAAAWVAHAADPLDGPAMHKLLVDLDERSRNTGDYRAAVFIEQKRRDQPDLLYEADVFRRDEEDKLVILFTKPRTEAGKGYLKIEKNLFLFDPTVGKWERRTERERIAGTDSRRADFDELRLSVEFDPVYVGLESLGRYKVHHLKLTAKAGADVAYPVCHMWIEVDSGDLFKRQDYALSGKLVRTVYYAKYVRVFSPTKKAELHLPQEMRIFDELETGNSTTIAIRSINLDPLDPNIFTKAWVESRSR